MSKPGASGASSGDGLRRDLGTIESYAALIGILVGAGIFRVTSDAFALTGPSVILGYLVLAPIVLATSVAYVVFLSTPLGRWPGGEYLHIARTFDSRLGAFLGAWLKIIAYLGACAFLATVLADYVLELDQQSTRWLDAERHRLPLALISTLAFFAIHCRGVRWFGRMQVLMGALLFVSILVLVVPGLPAIEMRNYRPFFRGGTAGFLQSLPPLFFAYAGFESLAQTAGEVRDSERRLPRVFLRGILATTVIFLAISTVAFGVLPGAELATSRTPMSDVASRYLPFAPQAIVTLGAILAVATSLNASLMVPARLALVLAHDGLLPRSLGSVHASTGTPVVGLTASVVIVVVLILTQALGLALNIAVAALVILYAIHSYALLRLPRLNPELFAEVSHPIPLRWQRIAALVSLAGLLAIIGVQITGDLETIRASSALERWSSWSPTSLELMIAWSVLGALLYSLRPKARPSGSPART